MTQSSYHVATLGNAIVDILAHIEDEALRTLQIQKGSWCLLTAQESRALYEKIPPAIEQSGGSAANTMAAFTSLGGRGAYIGKVHDDEFGHIFAHDLKASGVVFKGCIDPHGSATGKCIILVTPDADRSMSTYLGASIEIGPEDVDEDVIKNAEIFFSEAYLWAPLNAQQALLKGVSIARRYGRKVALTLSDPDCVKTHQQDLLPFIKNHVDILIGNDAEIMALFDEDFEVASHRAKQVCETVALTCGVKGSLIHHQGETHAIERAPVTQVLDTTGAGDVYAGGLLYGMTHGYDIKTSGRIASLAAADILTHLGSRPEKSLSFILQKL